MTMRIVVNSLLSLGFLSTLPVIESMVKAQESLPASGGVAVGGGLPVSSGLPKRRLAEGILTVIPPVPHPEETSLGPIDLDLVGEHPELAWTAPDFPENRPFFSAETDTLLAKSRGVVLRHSVYALEFSFKPVRMIEVPMEQPDGQMENQLVWYLLYQVRYVGNDLNPTVTESANGIPVPESPKKVQEDWVLFVPRFTLTSTQSNREYSEKILPAAKAMIAAKERVGAPILDSFEMLRKIPVSDARNDHPVWGVATWTDIDPSTDYFMVTVEGLTNAYRIRGQGNDKKFEKKCLQLHFWRPGDTVAEKEDVIRLGVPAFEEPERVQYALDQFGIKERLDYKWVYR